MLVNQKVTMSIFHDAFQLYFHMSTAIFFKIEHYTKLFCSFF